MAITHTVYRIRDGEEVAIEIEASGLFDRNGDLADYHVTPDDMKLSEDERTRIEEKLKEEHDDDFDEDKADMQRRGE